MKRVLIPCLGLLAFAAADVRGDSPGDAPTTISLKPAPAPVPALRYLLLPPRHQQVPGNAAIFYHRAVERLIEINLRSQLQAATLKADKKSRPPQEAVTTWMEVPIAELPREEVRNYLSIYTFCLEETELGSIRETCDWGYYHRVVGYTLPMNELQEIRQIGRLLALRARLEIAEGRFDAAVLSLRTGFAVADHLTRAPMMIPMFTGSAVLHFMSTPLMDICQAPGAPNLYWALANLPRPLLDIRPSVDGERFALEQDFPELKQLDSGVWSVERARAFAEDIRGRFSRYLDHWARFSDRPNPNPMEHLADSLKFAAIIGRSYPDAKRRLVEKGRPAATVEAMPAVQVVALDSYLTYEEARDESFKWAGLPYPQAVVGMRNVKLDWTTLQDGIPFASMLPAIQGAVMIPARNQRQIDVVQILESIRLHAAKNGGKLPASLDALTDAPVPSDPLTGMRYDYALYGESATLSYSAPPGFPDRPPFAAKYVVKLSPSPSVRQSSLRSDHSTMTLPLFLALTTTLLSPPDDPRARSIAPFLDSGVIAVGRLDLARVDADRLTRGWFAKREQAESVVRESGPWINALRKAGAREVYFLFKMPDMGKGPASLPPVVVPLAAGADGKAIGELLRRQGPGGWGPGWQETETIHGAVVAATRSELERARHADAPERPELAEALAGLGDSVADFVLMPGADARRVLEEIIPNLPEPLGGGPITNLTRGIPWVALGLTGDPEPRLQVIIRGKDEAALKALQGLGQGVRKLVPASPAVAQSMPGIGQILEDIKPVLGPDRITMTLDPAKAAVVARGILLPARQSAARQECVNNLKQIGLAMHNYHDRHKSFPPAYSTDASGKPLLSWRVLILPFLDQASLYKEFHLDEPWDSPHNRTLIDRMPQVYRCAGSGDDPPPAGKTSYLTPRGESTIFPGAKTTDLRSITDGTSNTLFVVDLPNDRAVTWTRPDDWEIATGVDPKGILSRHSGGSEVLFGDGSVRYIKDAIKETTLKALLTRNGGEVVPFDDIP